MESWAVAVGFKFCGIRCPGKRACTECELKFEDEMKKLACPLAGGTPQLPDGTFVDVIPRLVVI